MLCYFYLREITVQGYLFSEDIFLVVIFHYLYWIDRILIGCFILGWCLISIESSEIINYLNDIMLSGWGSQQQTYGSAKKAVLPWHFTVAFATDTKKENILAHKDGDHILGGWCD